MFNALDIIGCWPKFWRRKKIHWSSLVVEPKALYFASAEEQDIVWCFFDLHETNTQYTKQWLEVERLMSIHPTQYASLKKPSRYDSEE